MDHNRIRRPIRSSDFVVIVTETAYNLSQVVSGFFESLYELSIYHSNQKTETNQAWEKMTQDLETLEEEQQ
jgi:hypothetical protein